MVIDGEVMDVRQFLIHLNQLSDVGELFDGSDLNEHSHEQNADLMEGALDRINAAVRVMQEHYR